MVERGLDFPPSITVNGTVTETFPVLPSEKTSGLAASSLAGSEGHEMAGVTQHHSGPLRKLS
jgi:hypothetical protein